MDGTIPTGQLPLRAEADRRDRHVAGLGVANVFHAGDGNLHPLVIFDANKPGEMEKAEVVGDEILKLCVEVGGCLTGEHGVGIEKRDLMPSQFGPGGPRTADARARASSTRAGSSIRPRSFRSTEGSRVNDFCRLALEAEASTDRRGGLRASRRAARGRAARTPRRRMGRSRRHVRRLVVDRASPASRSTSRQSS